MGQTKTKFDCPLCGSQADQDDGCDSPPPLKPDAPFAFSVYIPEDVTVSVDDNGGGSGEGAGKGCQYVTLPLTSVAEESGCSGDATAADGDVTKADNAPVGLPPHQPINHSSSGASIGRHSMVVLRGNQRHHGSGGHRVR